MTEREKTVTRLKGWDWRKITEDSAVIPDAPLSHGDPEIVMSLLEGLAQTNGQDVSVEASGPELNARDFASLHTPSLKDSVCPVCLNGFRFESAMQLNCCSHHLHLDCLQEMNNKVEKSSNKCPECRQEICPPSERRPIFHVH